MYIVVQLRKGSLLVNGYIKVHYSIMDIHLEYNGTYIKTNVCIKVKVITILQIYNISNKCIKCINYCNSHWV